MLRIPLRRRDSIVQRYWVKNPKSGIYGVSKPKRIRQKLIYPVITSDVYSFNQKEVNDTIDEWHDSYKKRLAMLNNRNELIDEFRHAQKMEETNLNSLETNWNKEDIKDADSLENFYLVAKRVEFNDWRQDIIRGKLKDMGYDIDTLKEKINDHRKNSILSNSFNKFINDKKRMDVLDRSELDKSAAIAMNERDRRILENKKKIGLRKSATMAIRAGNALQKTMLERDKIKKQMYFDLPKKLFKEKKMEREAYEIRTKAIESGNMLEAKRQLIEQYKLTPGYKESVKRERDLASFKEAVDRQVERDNAVYMAERSAEQQAHDMKRRIRRSNNDALRQVRRNMGEAKSILKKQLDDNVISRESYDSQVSRMDDEIRKMRKQVFGRQ